MLMATLVDVMSSPIKLTFDYDLLNGNQKADKEGRASAIGTFYNLDVSGICTSQNIPMRLLVSWISQDFRNGRRSRRSRQSRRVRAIRTAALHRAAVLPQEITAVPKRTVPVIIPPPVTTRRTILEIPPLAARIPVPRTITIMRPTEIIHPRRLYPTVRTQNAHR